MTKTIDLIADTVDMELLVGGLIAFECQVDDADFESDDVSYVVTDADGDEILSWNQDDAAVTRLGDTVAVGGAHGLSAGIYYHRFTIDSLGIVFDGRCNVREHA